MKSTIPGLSRGISVLNLLTSPMTTDEIVAATDIPKTTVVRILGTLRQEGLVTKSDTTRTYLAKMKLMPCEGTGDEFEDLLDGVLARLAAQTDHTSEWYLPVGKSKYEGGQVLARRFVPPQAEVHVRSWVGEVRPLIGQLDAVMCASRASWGDLPDRDEEFWVFGPACERVPVDREDAERRLKETERCGSATDAHFNPRGIKRVATAVWGESQPVGVLAVAYCNVPGLAAQQDRDLSILLREAASLSAQAPEKLHRRERSRGEPLNNY